MFYISEKQFSSNIDMRIHKDINAFELKEPTECNEYQGYYYIPDNNYFYINKLISSLQP